MFKTDGIKEKRENMLYQAEISQDQSWFQMIPNMWIKQSVIETKSTWGATDMAQSKQK